VTDFQLVLRVVGYIFAACAFLAVAETAIDAFVHQPMAEFLVKRFADLMLVCVSTIGGLLAGQKIESRKKLREKRVLEAYPLKISSPHFLRI